MPNRSWHLGKLAAFLLVGSSMGLLLGACDTEVVNPGPIEDDDLFSPGAQGAMVRGAGRAFAEGLNWTAYTSASVAREIHPSGSTGSFGITVQWQRGVLPVDQTSTHWNNAQRARWLAEEAVRRIEALDPAEQDADQLAQAYLWGGYANRLLGELMCQAVIDGGGAQAHTVYFDRALDDFTEAMNSSDADVALAAQAGRASVHVQLENWAAAEQDAFAVTGDPLDPADPDWSYEVPYYDIGEDDQKNRIFVATEAEPYKAHSTWNTWVAGNDETGVAPYGFNEDMNPNGDPRVPWEFTDEVGDANAFGRAIPWWPEMKHDAADSPIKLSSAAEMRLIQAEAELVMNSDDVAAMAIINAVRDDADVGSVTASNLDEAWAALKRERAIVLWLEGRRLGDLRRWDANGTPGDLHPLEEVSAATNLTTRDFCFPIPDSERETNPNIPVI